METKIEYKILDLIFNSIISEGGDGDAIWLSKHSPIEELAKLVKYYNALNTTGWEIIIKENHLLWGNDYEWAIVTNDKEFFVSQPAYLTLKIDY
jgi:hypothetical protein